MKLSACSVISIALIALFSRSPLRGQEPSKDVARASVEKALEAIQTLDCEYEITYELSTKFPEYAKAFDKHDPCEGKVRRYKYFSSGGNFFLEETDITGEILPFKIWNGQDFLIVDRGKGKEIRVVKRQKTIPRIFEATIRPPHILGAEVYHYRESIPDFLSIEKCQFEKTIGSGDDTTWQFFAKNVDTLYGEPMDVRFELSPQHSFLPSKITYLNKRGFFNQWHVDRFEKVKNEATGEDCWFPIVARLEVPMGMHTSRVEFKRLVINGDVTISTFDPLDDSFTLVLDRETGETTFAVDQQIANAKIRMTLPLKKKGQPKRSHSPAVLIFSGLILASSFAVGFLLLRRQFSNRASQNEDESKPSSN